MLTNQYQLKVSEDLKALIFHVDIQPEQLLTHDLKVKIIKSRETKLSMVLGPFVFSGNNIFALSSNVQNQEEGIKLETEFNKQKYNVSVVYEGQKEINAQSSDSVY